MVKRVIQLIAIFSIIFIFLPILGHLAKSYLEIATPTSNPGSPPYNLPPAAPEEIRVFSYNIFLRPPLVSLLDAPVKRAEEISLRVQALNADILTLQEAWHPTATRCLIELLKDEFPYYIIASPDNTSRTLTSGGLTIFSRWPIIETHTIVYDNCCFDDCLTSKGAVHILVQLSQGAYLNVITTHLDANDTAGDMAARASQIDQLQQFLKDIQTNGHPTIITGDFNTDHLSQSEGYDGLLKQLALSAYRVENPSTLNCNFLSSIYCRHPADPKEIDYVFTLENETRLKRLQTRHLILPALNINPFVQFLSDHRAVWVEFETDFGD